MTQEPEVTTAHCKPESDEDGQNLIEYGLLSLFAVISVQGLSNVIANAFMQVANNLTATV